MRIKILYNTKKAWAPKLAKEVSSYLKKNGFEIVKKGADATAVIGGDGTLLYYAFRKELQGCIIGIGGKSSKICQLRRDDWSNIVQMLKNKKTEERTMLEIEVGRKSYNVINDVVLHTTNYRVIDMEVNINGKNYFFKGDGIIASTATGSTGYAYSAGANVLEPRSRKIIIAPICAYMREFSPMVLEENTKISIRSENKAAVIIDGMFIRNIKNRTIGIKRGKTWQYLQNK